MLLCPAWDGQAVCNARAERVPMLDAIDCVSGHRVYGQTLHRQKRHPYRQAPLPEVHDPLLRRTTR